jgi:hypothetical protein
MNALASQKKGTCTVLCETGPLRGRRKKSQEEYDQKAVTSLTSVPMLVKVMREKEIYHEQSFRRNRGLHDRDLTSVGQ